MLFLNTLSISGPSHGWSPQTGMPFLHSPPVKILLCHEPHLKCLCLPELFPDPCSPNMPPLGTLCFFSGTLVVPCIRIILVPSPSLGYKWFGLHPTYLCIPLPPPMSHRLLHPCLGIFGFNIWRAHFPKDTKIKDLIFVLNIN